MITPGAFKADLFRLIILYHFGGVYSDIGHMFLQPMTNFINFDFDECVLVKDLQDGFIQIHNAFMAAYPRHPLIKSMLIHITKILKINIMVIVPLQLQVLTHLEFYSQNIMVYLILKILTLVFIDSIITKSSFYN